MVSAEARIETERPSRYLVQLCRHAAAMADPGGEGPRLHDPHAGPDRGPDHEPDHGPDHEPDHGPDRGPDLGADLGEDHDSARASHGPMHRPPHHAARSHGLQIRVEWTEERGHLQFEPWGRCTAEARGSALVLRVDAVDVGALRRIQDIVTADLDRFGRRDGLVVAWQPVPSPDVRQGVPDGDA